MKEADRIRKHFGSEWLTLAQVSRWLGYDRHTTEEKIKHLPAFTDGNRKWSATMIGDYIETHMMTK